MQNYFYFGGKTMPNLSSNNMFPDNSLDLARMYGFDPYNVNNSRGRASATQGESNDILTQIYNDEANQSASSKGPTVNLEMGKIESQRSREEVNEQQMEESNMSNTTPPPQGDQTFPTQHGEETVESSGNMMQNGLVQNNAQQGGATNAGETREIQDGMSPANNIMSEGNIQQGGVANVGETREIQDGVSPANNMMLEGNIQQGSTQSQSALRGTQQIRSLQSSTPEMLDISYDELRRANIVPNNIENIRDFMKTQIGKNVFVQSIVGIDTLVEKSGVLLYVGNDYIILNECVPGDNLLLIEIPAIRFIRFEQ